VSETRATTTAGSTPEFPPGRYGRRRSGRRGRAVPIILLALVVAGSVLLSVRLYDQFGRTDYQAQIVGWDEPTDTRMTIRFTVRVPPGRPAACTLRARAFDGTELGRRDTVVHPVGDATTIEANEPVPTTARASVGDVLGCRPVD